MFWLSFGYVLCALIVLARKIFNNLSFFVFFYLQILYLFSNMTKSYSKYIQNPNVME